MWPRSVSRRAPEPTSQTIAVSVVARRRERLPVGAERRRVVTAAPWRPEIARSLPELEIDEADRCRPSRPIATVEPSGLTAMMPPARPRTFASRLPSLDIPLHERATCAFVRGEHGAPVGREREVERGLLRCRAAHRSARPWRVAKDEQPVSGWPSSPGSAARPSRAACRQGSTPPARWFCSALDRDGEGPEVGCRRRVHVPSSCRYATAAPVERCRERAPVRAERETPRQVSRRSSGSPTLPPATRASKRNSRGPGYAGADPASEATAVGAERRARPKSDAARA